MTFAQFAYRVSMEDEICFNNQRYILVGATLVTCNSWASKQGHIVTAVRAPDSHITIINDSDIWNAGTTRWSSVEALQTRSDPCEILLPSMLIYRRVWDAPPALPAYARGSIASDPNVEKAILAMKGALPHIDLEDLQWEYYRNDESIQQTIDYFLTCHNIEKKVTFDQIVVGYLEDVINAYVKFPQLGVKKVYEIVQTKRGAFDYAVKELKDIAGRRVNYSFQEAVGDAGFNVNLDVVDEAFIDGWTEFACTTDKKVKIARLFGMLVDPKHRVESAPPSSPASSPTRQVANSINLQK